MNIRVYFLLQHLINNGIKTCIRTVLCYDFFLQDIFGGDVHGTNYTLCAM